MAHNGPISLGRIRNDSPPVFLKIDTRELASQSPWLKKVSGLPPFLEMSGGFSEERSLGNNVLLRRYGYELKISKIPPAGEVVGEIRLSSDDPGSPPVLSVPIHGYVNPKVYASPKVLFASLEKGKANPLLTLTLVADDPGFKLDVAPLAVGSDALEVRRRKVEGSRVMFTVSPHRRTPSDLGISGIHNEPP